MANCDLGVVDLGSQCFVCTCPSHDDVAGEKILGPLSVSPSP